MVVHLALKLSRFQRDSAVTLWRRCRWFRARGTAMGRQGARVTRRGSCSGSMLQLSVTGASCSFQGWWHFIGKFLTWKFQPQVAAKECLDFKCQIATILTPLRPPVVVFFKFLRQAARYGASGASRWRLASNQQVHDPKEGPLNKHPPNYPFGSSDSRYEKNYILNFIFRKVPRSFDWIIEYVFPWSWS